MERVETQLTEENWLSTFKHFDVDKNGTISCGELQSALASLGRKCSKGEVGQMISRAGVDPSKPLDFETFCYVMRIGSQERVLRRSDLQQIFNAVDIDCSGYLTAAELRHFLTEIDVHKEDAVMSEMIKLYDLDGSGDITMSEFEAIILSLGFTIAEDEPEVTATSCSLDTIKEEEEKQEPSGTEGISLDSFDDKLRVTMEAFDLNGSGMVYPKDIAEAAELLRKKKLNIPNHLHWDASRQRQGLGDNVLQANHLAIIVSDVGRSAQFYSNVLGFQQIRRPNFDKHGAWFTMGNLELHLIKGIPIVHSGDDLIVGHISIDVKDIGKVPSALRKLRVPFRQNVSVPKGKDSGKKGTNSEKDSEGIVRQYFIRDPDGYYVEICNCQVLTKYCLGEKKELETYEESVQPLTLQNAAVAIGLMNKWSSEADKHVKDRRVRVEDVRKTDGSAAAIANLLGCEKAEEVNEELFRNFCVRLSVYGDICQNESEESLKEILKLAGNSADAANEIMHLKAERTGETTFRPPAFYEDQDKAVPPSFRVKMQ